MSTRLGKINLNELTDALIVESVFKKLELQWTDAMDQ